MGTIERVMWVMTHVNIGATLGMAAWVLWSGGQVESGPWKIPHVDASTTQTPAPAWRQPVERPCCFVPRGEGPADHRALQFQDRPTDLLARTEHGGAL